MNHTGYICIHRHSVEHASCAHTVPISNLRAYQSHVPAAGGTVGVPLVGGLVVPANNRKKTVGDQTVAS